MNESEELPSVKYFMAKVEEKLKELKSIEKEIDTADEETHSIMVTNLSQIDDMLWNCLYAVREYHKS